jgi:hypothetical protein
MAISWESLFGLVLAAIPIIESRKDKDHERATAALNALSDAFYSTSSYYDSPILDANKKREAQLNIAQKWDNTANLMRPFDTNLWSRFNLKSRFWYEGEAWTEQQITGANIGLKKVRKDARFLLISKQHAANK